jgi:glycolate oxidase
MTAPYLEATRDPDAVRAMRAIKAALDPRGILNPGKMLQGPLPSRS